MKWEEPTELEPLTFPHILPQIIFLCVGLILGTVVFMVEICCKKSKMGNYSMILHVSPTMEVCPQPGPSHVREDGEKINELVVVSIEHYGDDEK